MKKIFFIFLILMVVLAGYFVYKNYFGIKNNGIATNNNVEINSFDDCLAAGNPAMESYPRQCNTADGKHFTENIGNELEMANLIKIDNPRPNAKVTSPLQISGQARGNWFFEASFPIKLVDKNNNEIARGTAQAQGEWMVENFVPFTATLEFLAPAKTTGTLILKKDNPSGLPENESQLMVPVKF